MEENICRQAENYFVTAYLQDMERFDHILFLLNDENRTVGSCIAWQDKRNDSFVSPLHWLIVDEKYQGKGLGKALCCAAMNIFKEKGNLPVYIHTQPWSWKTIFLYLTLGFKLQKTATFSLYENEYDKAMAEFRKIVREDQFQLLQDFLE